MLSSSVYPLATFGTADLKSSVGGDYYSYYRGDFMQRHYISEKLQVCLLLAAKNLKNSVTLYFKKTFESGYCELVRGGSSATLLLHNH